MNTETWITHIITITPLPRPNYISFFILKKRQLGGFFWSELVGNGALCAEIFHKLVIALFELNLKICLLLIGVTGFGLQYCNAEPAHEHVDEHIVQVYGDEEGG